MWPDVENFPGFAVDVTGPRPMTEMRFRQAITAAGNGCRAGIEAEHYPSERRDEQGSQSAAQAW